MNRTKTYILQSLSMIVIMTSMLLSSCATQKTEYKIPDPKAATVSEENPFKDKLQFPFDDKGLDLNVNLSFNETDNILTLCITGTRQLMVFRQDAFYGNLFYHPFLKDRVLDVKKMPYPVLVRPDMKVTLSKNAWKAFRKPRNRHLFNNWLVGISPELQAITPSINTEQSPEATLIVDSIVQRFKVDPKATQASFTLRNFLVIDKDGEPVASATMKRNPSKGQHYQIVYENDLNLTYNVRIQRNPCFGKEELIEAAQAQVSNIKKAYDNLRAACPTGTVSTEGEQGVFKQHKHLLLSQYAAITDSTACTTLQGLYAKYNSYVDSIINAPCVYVKPIVEVEKDNIGRPVIGVRPSILLDAAHRLDNIVASLLVSRDPAQIHDLIELGEEVIQTITKSVRSKGLINEEQHKAYSVFLKAKSYFTSNVLRH